MEVLTIKNKRHGKEYTVTSEEWAAMESKGYGKKVFDVVDRRPIVQPPQSKRTMSAPPEALPEVVEIMAKKAKQGEVAATKGTEENA